MTFPFQRLDLLRTGVILAGLSCAAPSETVLQVDGEPDSEYDLTPDKVTAWRQWMDIYRREMLPTGTYLGRLYDIGFDRSEAHVVEKNESLYYAFYGDAWDGVVELRGLEERIYRVRDYVRDVELGQITGPVGQLKVRFNGSLLIRATPE